MDIEALVIAKVCGALGAGRARATDTIQPAVGLVLSVQVGQMIKAGEQWAELHHEDDQVPADLMNNLLNAVVIGPECEFQTSRILEVIN